ncbi:glycosyltransferase family 2 protein [Iningainema tapete]|uniref:Glycosyltransferase n=1 Tax=Iningainema tapete BLCC-T55 TaxID=2748662 RepID=A0A8J6XXN5_9CYAN|nr:glycosyltransferase [Iningainema tapete]MBD2778357.1 glycosyltransferase [Iningainema tapete BLCC-T55]
MPKISVVVPAYNAESTILATIESIQKQTFSDLEIIVINDGSKDRTVELVNTVKDSRLKVFSYENGGLPVARNRGISRATGEYISFIDSDDLWTPNKLADQLAALQKRPEAGVAYSWTSVMDENAQVFYSGTPVFCEGDVYPDLLVCNFIASGSNILVRREAIEETGEFDPTLRSAEDWDYSLRLARKWHFVVVPKAQILYRKSTGAMSSKIDVMEKYGLMVLDKEFQVVPPHLQHLKKRGQATVYEYMAELALRYASPAEKAQKIASKLQKAIRLNPQLLMKKKVQILIFKLVLIQVLSPKIAENLLQLISKLRSHRMADLTTDRAVS